MISTYGKYNPTAPSTKRPIAPEVPKAKRNGHSLESPVAHQFSRHPTISSPMWDQGVDEVNLRGSIRSCGRTDETMILTIINESAEAYRDVIPPNRYHEPYMPLFELRKEMSEMTFFAYEEDGMPLGVVGFQPIKDVTLVRHLYVFSEHQRRSIGKTLIEHVIRMAKTRRILVGSWEAASWATRFYQKNGFKLLPNKRELLREYWNIPERQMELSVVLGLEK